MRSEPVAGSEFCLRSDSRGSCPLENGLASALETFFARVPPVQAETLRGLLLAQINDEAMRSLILQALAHQDESLLKIYVHLGLNVAVLNEFQDDLCPELAKRFGLRNERP